MSKYERKGAGPIVVDAIQITFGTIREKIRAFDKRVMVSPDWDGWDRWLMLPDGAREFIYGDWIIKNGDGYLWFCTDDTFVACYTPYESHRLVDSDAYYVAPDPDRTLRSIIARADTDFRKDVYLGGTE